MGQKVTIGGNRLGAGKKMTAQFNNFQRSTHDLGFAFRSSMACGTLVPCLNLVALPGDTHYINVDAFVRTLPTLRPLFGSFKLQIDVFTIPIRLYNAALHNNQLGIGMDMSSIYLPQLLVETYGIKNPIVENIEINNRQINQSSLLAYLGIRNNGHKADLTADVKRYFNAIGLLGYWDIYKNYFANKQEPNGYYMDVDPTETYKPIGFHFALSSNPNVLLTANVDQTDGDFSPVVVIDVDNQINEIFAYCSSGGGGTDGGNIYIQEVLGSNKIKLKDAFATVVKTIDNGEIEGWRFTNPEIAITDTTLNKMYFYNDASIISSAPTAFELSDIDQIRDNILKASSTAPFVLHRDYSNGFQNYLSILKKEKAINVMQGLGVKTYQSDIFNNWVQTDWLTGDNGVATVTAISTAGGSFTMDTLNLSQKLYNMLTKVALSGGSYNDWIGAVYSNGGYWTCETPVYCGGLSKEVVFEEVVSTAATEENPQGNLAGKGVMGHKKKGGSIKIKTHEPSMIMGIVSLTPRLDYSQGNEWFNNLQTVNDFHKPDLDEIGMQDLITDWMNGQDTLIGNDMSRTFYSVGKQPAWIQYMTNFNKCYGNFADTLKEMSMTLNRNYDINEETSRLRDITTYINPIKFNYPFAQVSLDAQNFWTQIGWEITARRLMSAKIIPNL